MEVFAQVMGPLAVLSIMAVGGAAIARSATSSWRVRRTDQSLTSRMTGVDAAHDEVRDGLLWRWAERRRAARCARQQG